ncbi:MAG: single-stranded DNA-binding protein [Termitinemataceae bacterium]|nr:MAG: single-stranded DNA-binding protein [Termitinemataceae bacterium]
MSNMNAVILTGYLTKDAEYKMSALGTAVCSFVVAVNYPKKNGNKWEDDVNFVDTAIFGKRAARLHEYLKKGTQVGIYGHLETSRWSDDNVNHSRLEVRTDQIHLLDRKNKAEPEIDTESVIDDLVDSDLIALGLG